MSYKLLIVDDDQALLKMLGSYFTIKGYEVCSAVTGEEAMEKCRNRTDLILLDINMPGMDGLEVCRQIRNEVSCPILFLTAKVEEQDRVNGLLSDGDKFLMEFCDFILTYGLLVFAVPGILIAVAPFYRNKIRIPLKELTTASRRIGENDLDFQITY